MGPLVSSWLLQESQDLAMPAMAPPLSQGHAVLWLLVFMFFQGIGINLVASSMERGTESGHLRASLDRMWRTAAA